MMVASHQSNTMKKLRKLTSLSLMALGFSVLSTGLFAQEPPVVTYTVSGVSGDYTLDFTVNNASPGTGNQDIYEMGIYDPNGSVSSAPSSFINYSAFYPSGYYAYGLIGDGTMLSYNDLWVDTTFSALPPGTTLSGFTILDTGATPPTSVPYAMGGYGSGADYTGPDNLYLADNTAFEGNATLSAVPDAGATMPLLGVALVALGGVSRRFRKT